ncbi:Longitudinals lacking protein-like [Orchesella cincta]|uniref:Longitudinals lacking protein-like n=1 Tax=Orchesella cincta TaxID=48709 RepID=A0A1D2MQ50_ORCCI|nr:Longitudinals lacking protein-like [Orchesella cincta]
MVSLLKISTSSNQNSYNFSWGDQQNSHILDGLKTLAVGEVSNVFLTDVTLACEGEYIEAHRLVLSLCSNFFRDLFNQNERISEKSNGIVILGHVSAKDMRYILQFMYQGAIELPQEDVNGFLEAGRMLKVEGLVEGATAVGGGRNDKQMTNKAKPCPQSKKSVVSTPTPKKRRRASGSSVSGDDADKSIGQLSSVNVKSEPCQLRVVTSFDDDDDAVDPLDDGGMLMDDFGDAGGDSDFGGGEMSLLDEGVTPSIPVPSTSRVGIIKTVTPKRESGGRGRKSTKPNSNDSSSSSDDDGGSSDSSDENYIDSPPPSKVRKPRRALNWKYSQSFPTLEEAISYVKSTRKWSMRYKRKLFEGTKYAYDCNISRHCPSKLYVLQLTEENKTEIYITGEGHDHEEKVKTYGLSVEVKEKINQLWESGVKRPRRILWTLKKEGIEPKSTQIVSYIHYKFRSNQNESEVDLAYISVSGAGELERRKTWGDQQSHILDGLKTLAVGEVSNVFLTDVTLACDGEYIEAHRLVLSLCSTFFKDLFNQNERITDKANGVVILGHVSAKDMRYILQFMYQGSVKVPEVDVNGFLEAGNMLKVEVLCSSRLALDFSESTSLSREASSKPCTASKKLNVSVAKSPPQLSKRRHSSSLINVSEEETASFSTKRANFFQDDVKQELGQREALNDLEDDDDDDVGGLMDHFGDDGGDSDFGSNGNSGTFGGGDIVAVTGPSTSSTTTPKPESNNKKKTVKLKTEDSNSSSSDDDGSSSDSSVEDYFDSPPKRKLTVYRRFDWDLSTTFTNMEEAKAHVKSAKKWRIRNVKTVLEGTKYCYDCLVSRDCPTKMYLLDETTRVQLYETGLDHNHGDVKKTGLPVEVKEKINQIWASGVKRPKRVWWELKKQEFEPKLSQVVSYIKYNFKTCNFLREQMDSQNAFTFKWGSQQSHILEGLRSLAVGEISNVFLTDVTLACEGEYIEAHRLVLSLCSSFFKDLFSQNEKISDKANGIVILGHVSAKDLRYILQFMYQGAIELPQEDVNGFLEASNMLKVEGLVGSSRVGVGLSETLSRTGGPTCPRSKKPSHSMRHRHSPSSKYTVGADSSDDEVTVADKRKPVFVLPPPSNSNPPPNIKRESNEFPPPVLTSFDNPDNGDSDNDAGGGMMLDDYGDDGDSDFGGVGRGDVSVPALVGIPEPSIITAESIRPGKLKRESNKQDDSSSSGDDSSGGSSSSTENYFDSPPPERLPKRKRKSHNWVLSSMTFPTVEDGRAYLRAEKKWMYRCGRQQSEGRKFSYDCSFSRECPAKIRLFENKETPHVEVYVTDQDHNHENIKKQGLTLETKEKINQLWASGIKKPKKILAELVKGGIEPKLTQPLTMIYLTPSSTLQNCYSINWNSQQSHIVDGIKQLATCGGGRDPNDLFLTDVTLASCDGEYVPAHRLILSLCSSFFKELFQRSRAFDKSSNTVLILGHVSGRNLRQLMEFIYSGSVEIRQEDVESFLQAGCMLKIEGLIDSNGAGAEGQANSTPGGLSPPPGEVTLHIPEPSPPISSSSPMLTVIESNNANGIGNGNVANHPSKNVQLQPHAHLDSQDHSQSSSSTGTGGEVESTQYCQVELKIEETCEDEGREMESNYFAGRADPLQLFPFASSPPVGGGGGTPEQSTSTGKRAKRKRRASGESDSRTNPSTSTSASADGSATAPKKRHPIWNLYHYDPEVNACICNISGCKSTLSGKKTTNLMRHLNYYHPDEFKQLFGEQPPPSSSSSSSSTTSSEYANSRNRPL